MKIIKTRFKSLPSEPLSAPLLFKKKKYHKCHIQVSEFTFCFYGAKLWNGLCLESMITFLMTVKIIDHLLSLPSCVY